MGCHVIQKTARLEFDVELIKAIKNYIIYTKPYVWNHQPFITQGLASK